MLSYSSRVDKRSDIIKLYPIPTFDGYFINKNGEIYSSKRRKINKMIYKTDKDGYKYLGMYRGRKRMWRRVHVMVAITFIPNP